MWAQHARGSRAWWCAAASGRQGGRGPEWGVCLAAGSARTRRPPACNTPDPHPPSLSFFLPPPQPPTPLLTPTFPPPTFISFSFPNLSCEFATLDVSDAMGLKRLNLTKTVGASYAPLRCAAQPNPLPCCAAAGGGGGRSPGCHLRSSPRLSTQLSSALPCCFAAWRLSPMRAHPPLHPPCTPPCLHPQVRKLPITEDMVRAGVYMEDKQHADPKYDEEHPVSGDRQDGFCLFVFVRLSFYTARSTL